MIERLGEFPKKFCSHCSGSFPGSFPGSLPERGRSRFRGFWKHAFGMMAAGPWVCHGSLLFRFRFMFVLRVNVLRFCRASLKPRFHHISKVFPSIYIHSLCICFVWLKSL